MYDMIFKRKSFHIFRNTGSQKLTEQDLADIKTAFDGFIPLHPEIKTAIRIVSSEEKLLGRGAEYAIQIYSENKDNYLTNAGYLGEQLDLYLVSRNIGSLCFGLGKPDDPVYEGLHHVIMILVAKVQDESCFRSDMFKSKRKPLEEIWNGDIINGVSDIARFAPSACNSQPWFVERSNHKFSVFRKKPARVGIMPAFIAKDLNRIDMGIYLYILEVCLKHTGIEFKREIYTDSGAANDLTLVASYSI